MNRVTRRTFLATAAAAVTAPGVARSQTGDVDVVVVGAGAAGIAAARRLTGAKRRIVVVEAASRVGGRCVTDTAAFGVPFDLGAHWIHGSDVNPVAKLAPATGLDIYVAPQGQRLRIGRRNAREGESEDFLATLVRANRAIADAARGRLDVSCAQALPKDLGEWRPAIEFALGPFICGKDLDSVSALDMSRATVRDGEAFCRQGFGALLAKLAEGLPVRLDTPVVRIDSQARGGVEVETTKGRLTARHVIVTVSNGVLNAGKIKFTEVPRRQLEAASKLSLGSYDHIALELAGNPLALQSDDLVFERAGSNKTAALLANVGRSALCLVEVGGGFGRGLSAQGDHAMVAFATDWLADMFGADVRKAIKRSHATQWDKDPWTLGAFSAAPPGGQLYRRVLMEPVRERLWFAGEAAHETLWGTVGGAWESGDRAAEAVLKRLGRA